MTRYALQTTSSFDRYESVTCESIFMVVWNFDEQKCLDAMGDVKKICREVGGNIEEDAIECSLCRLLSLRDLFVLFVLMGEVEECDSFKCFCLPWRKVIIFIEEGYSSHKIYH